MVELNSFEERRIELQNALDSQKSQSERNRYGQFATPPALAREMILFGNRLLPENESIRFLDPAFGTGSFYSALLELIEKERIETAWGIEIDEHYGRPTKALWKDTPIKIKLTDFTAVPSPDREDDKFNFIICNPPYVRHHHIGSSVKERLQAKVLRTCGVRFNGLSGFYCYFMALTHGWLKKKGISGWLIPAEFMDVNYGASLKLYLLNQVTLLRVHRFAADDMQFKDAAVSSAIVWFRNEKPVSNNKITVSYGGTLTNPQSVQQLSAEELFKIKKWNGSPLSISPGKEKSIVMSDLFDIKRGIATGDNHFFILSRDQINNYNLPMKFLRPILPSPRYLKSDEIPADVDGNPEIERQLFLLDCTLPENVLKKSYPTLWNYFESGKPDVTSRYLCKNRNPWYAQEKRPHSPFLCTYMGRSNHALKKHPFRFILNHSEATAANVYLLLYPNSFLKSAFARDPELVRKVWNRLNQLSADVLLGESRVYGGGLYKLEPKELGNVPINALSELIPYKKNLLF